MLELQPDKCNTRVSIFDRSLTVSDFTNENSTIIQESRSIMQDHIDRIQTVIARRKTDLRFMSKFVGP